MDKRFVITVTRECGSGGDAIAKQLAGQLNIPLYNRDIIHQAAQKYDLSGILSSQEDKAAVKKRKNGLLHRIFFPGYDGDKAVKSMLFSEREQVVRLIAREENCVFLGSYSDFTLHECPYALHLYIYAPYETRVRNYMEELGVDNEEASAMIQTADEAIAYGYVLNTGYASDNKAHKHIMIDSSVLGIAGTAAMLVDLIRRKFAGADE